MDYGQVSDGIINFHRISETLYKIYFTLFFGAIMALVGGISNHFIPLGTANNGFYFILTILGLYIIDGQKQLKMFLIFLACSLFFGSTTTALMCSTFNLDEGAVIIYFGGVALLFGFHLFALRTHNIEVIYHINYFALPLLIISMAISLYFVSHGIFPHDLLYVIPFVVAVPFLWHLGLWFFRDKIWTWGLWVSLNFIFLTALSFFLRHNAYDLVGIYLSMILILENLKLHTYDSIDLAAHSDERALLPVSIGLTFFFRVSSPFLVFIASQIRLNEPKSKR